jgi:DNA topoisomerase-6 subunit A
MAKRKLTRAATVAAQTAKVVLTPRDKKTIGSLVGLADGVVSAAAKRRDPYVEIPSRTLSNVRYSARKKIIEMGTGKNRRQLFDLNQAKAYMPNCLPH